MARARTAFKWRGEQVLGAIKEQLGDRLELAAEMVASHVRRSVSTSTRANGPSQPGEPPHADTGTLRKSITTDVDRDALIARVGTNVPYGPHLEHGTSRMAARPFLERGFLEKRAAINALMRQPLGGGYGFAEILGN